MDEDEDEDVDVDRDGDGDGDVDVDGDGDVDGDEDGDEVKHAANVASEGFVRPQGSSHFTGRSGYLGEWR